MLKARLHPLPNGRYSVILDGKLLVEQSRKCDAARALAARGITGKLTLCDGKTGRPRTVIDIERAAKLKVEEGPYGPRFVRHTTVVDRACSAESDAGGYPAT
jgi:hypothetical protein